MKAFFLILLSLPLLLSAQIKSEEKWQSSMRLMLSGEFEQAKTELIELEELFPEEAEVLHFLGVCYDHLEQYDSAAFYYEQTLAFHQDDLAAFKRTHLRMVRMYLRRLDFERAYTLAETGLELFPQDADVRQELMDVCLWAYYIRYHGLNPSYLQNRMPDSVYTASSIREEYLVLRNLRGKAENELQFVKHSANDSSDYFVMRYTGTRDHFARIRFRKAWYPNDLGAVKLRQRRAARRIFNSIDETDYMRLGALLVMAPYSDSEIEGVLAQQAFTFRYCVCALLEEENARSSRKKCKKDDKKAVRLALPPKK